MADLTSRYKMALERLSKDAPMIKANESGIETPECKARVIYAKRVLENINNIEAIEVGVIAEMEKQTSCAPKVQETMVGEHPTSPHHTR